MTRKIVFGALLASVALCSQGFGFELLDRMLGLNCGGCGGCNACCDPACCEDVKCCTPEPACCEPKCCEVECCEPECCDPCGKSCCKKKCCSLLGALDGLFCCKKKCCGTSKCCEATCGTCGGEAAAPAEAPAEDAAPLPKAPVVDPSASLQRSQGVYQASRSIVNK